MRLIAGPTGVGKTTAMVEHTAKYGSTCWLSDRHEDVDAVVAKLEEHGCQPGRVLPLRGSVNGLPNCLHPDTIERWQEKRYGYRTGFCPLESCCERRADPEKCPFLRSIDLLKLADTVVCTKAMARGQGFFSKMGNPERMTVVLDEDPIGLLRQPVTVGRSELGVYLGTVREIINEFRATDDPRALQLALRSEAVGYAPGPAAAVMGWRPWLQIATAKASGGPAAWRPRNGMERQLVDQPGRTPSGTR